MEFPARVAERHICGHARRHHVQKLNSTTWRLYCNNSANSLECTASAAFPIKTWKPHDAEFSKALPIISSTDYDAS